jgi:hypothetical protein
VGVANSISNLMLIIMQDPLFFSHLVLLLLTRTSTVIRLSIKVHHYLAFFADHSINGYHGYTTKQKPQRNVGPLSCLIVAKSNGPSLSLPPSLSLSLSLSLFRYLFLTLSSLLYRVLHCPPFLYASVFC